MTRLEVETAAVKKFRPFVIGLARKYARVYGIDFDDLVQDGLLAIMSSARKWKKRSVPPLGWIQGPVHWALRRRTAEARGKGTRRISFDRPFAGGVRDTNSIAHASMDAELSTDGDAVESYTLHDILGMEDEHPDYFARRRLAAAIALLDPRERQVIRMRFAEDRVYVDIGRAFEITGERVRQIEAAALRKLRSALADREAPS